MTEKKEIILLVDDEADVLEFIRYNLTSEGFDVYTAENGLKAIEIAQEIHPDLIILDVMMPHMDGIETCERIRAIPELKNVMITFLTARGEDYSQIAGFNAGADDYITKPIRPKVLSSRVKALLRRSFSNIEKPEDQNKIIEIEDLVIDKEKFTVHKNSVEIYLPKKEFLLLLLLVSKPSKVFDRDYIFKEIWGDNIIVGERTIDVHIRKLREKIGEDYIKTVKGIGYKFDPKD